MQCLQHFYSSSMIILIIGYGVLISTLNIRDQGRHLYHFNFFVPLSVGVYSQRKEFAPVEQILSLRSRLHFGSPSSSWGANRK